MSISLTVQILFLTLATVQVRKTLPTMQKKKKMKQTICITIISIIGLFANSCSEDDSISGIINNVIDIPCVAHGQKEWIITNDSIYKQTFTYYSTTCTPPTIDFNKYSLLGVYTTGGCK